jgi:hypothetical protein
MNGQRGRGRLQDSAEKRQPRSIAPPLVLAITTIRPRWEGKIVNEGLEEKLNFCSIGIDIIEYKLTYVCIVINNPDISVNICLTRKYYTIQSIILSSPHMIQPLQGQDSRQPDLPFRQPSIIGHQGIIRGFQLGPETLEPPSNDREPHLTGCTVQRIGISNDLDSANDVMQNEFGVASYSVALILFRHERSLRVSPPSSQSMKWKYSTLILQMINRLPLQYHPDSRLSNPRSWAPIAVQLVYCSSSVNKYKLAGRNLNTD